VKGVESTVGYVAKIGNSVADKNSCLVDILLDLGAVLYVKTNIPQTLMVWTTQQNSYWKILKDIRRQQTQITMFSAGR
jgi:amidase